MRRRTAMTFFLVGGLLALSAGPAWALRVQFLLVSYDLGDLVPAGPEAERQVAALAEEIKTKIAPDAWKPRSGNTISTGDRSITVFAHESLPPRVTEHLLGLYAAKMSPGHKELHDRLARRSPMDFAGVPLEKALESFAKSSGIKVSLDADCRDRAKLTVNVRMREASAGLALRWLARSAGLDWAFRDGGIALKKAPEHPPVVLHRKFADQKIREETDELHAAIFDATFTKDLPATEFKDQPAADCLATLAKSLDVDLACDPACGALLATKLTLHLEAGRGAAGLDAVLKADKLKRMLRDGAIWVYPASAPDSAETIREKLARKRVSFEWVKKPGAEAFAFLAEAADVKMVCDGFLNNREITLRMSNAPAELALEWMLKLNNLKAIYRDGALYLVPDDGVASESSP